MGERRATWDQLLRTSRLGAHETLLLERRVSHLAGNIAPATLPAKEIEVGTVVLGRYRLDRQLGQGGQGRIFLAWDGRLAREVVIKTILHGGTGPEARRVLGAEARLAASVDDPNVVKVFDVVETPAETLLILEYVPGGTMRGLLNRKGKLSLREAIELFDGILEGLAAVHAAGIVHRDIKPENVLLDRSGRPRLADFGIARASRPGAHATILATPSAGTLAYMAPEQIRNAIVDTRADLYAIGVMLSEAVTGHLPIDLEGSDDFQAREQILRQPPTLEGVPPELAEIVLNLLAKDPTQRTPTVAALRAALRGER